MSQYSERYTRYQLDRSRLRKAVRGLYLAAAVRQLRGPTLDFGCGVGSLLQRLPAGSLGLEINAASVAHCQARGLDARVYDGDTDDWSLGAITPEAGLTSLVASHVLEHLEQPMDKLAKLLKACARLGITRALVIVPGASGYAIDSTHRTFVDQTMLSDPAIVDGSGFRMTSSRYFPGNFRWLGRWLPHHELQVLYQAKGVTQRP